VQADGAFIHDIAIHDIAIHGIATVAPPLESLAGLGDLGRRLICFLSFIT
jgi:hypothetical protein